MDRYEQLGDMLNAVGQHLADIIGEHPDGTYLYAEADEGSYEAGVFHDEGERVVYYDPSDDLFDELAGMWEFAEADKKWAVLHYEVKDGQFDVSFAYPDHLNPDESSFERRERALAERYGDKPVIYPKPDGNFRKLTLEDFPDDESEPA
jgi:hypothetical protein